MCNASAALRAGSNACLAAAGHHHESSHLGVPEAGSAESPSSSELLKRMATALEQLKNQHSALGKTFHSYPSIDTTIVGSPLPSTAEEDDEVHTPTTVGPGGKRMSAFSTHSGSSVWFDAPEYDGPEEYTLDVTPPVDSQDNNFFNTDSRLTDHTEASTEATEAGSSTGMDTDSESEVSAEKSFTEEPTVIHRRTSLPSGPVGDEGSLFAVLKKNVGKVGKFEQTPSWRR